MLLFFWAGSQLPLLQEYGAHMAVYDLDVNTHTNSTSHPLSFAHFMDQF